MTTAPLEGATVPQWTVGDRLRKARLHAGLEQTELAREIGISRATISSYEADKTTPSRPALLSWALRCGVPLGWLTGSGGGERETITATRAEESAAPIEITNYRLRAVA
jgi:transcriptional regulator with XRE-family HTH domain